MSNLSISIIEFMTRSAFALSFIGEHFAGHSGGEGKVRSRNKAEELKSEGLKHYFGVREATLLSKCASPRSGAQSGCNFKRA